MNEEVFMLAVITGASSGIGRELAYRFADLGYDLVLIARRKERLMEVKTELEKKDISVTVLVHDLEKIEQCKVLVDEIKNQEINVFVNNAGYGLYGYSMENSTEKEFDMISLNIYTLHYLTKRISELMKAGTIINISSMAAFLPTPLLASYAATKAYVSSYSEALNHELKMAKRPIKIMTVYPGPVKTEFNEVANASPKMKGLSVSKCVDDIIKGFNRKKNIVIPGFKMKLMRFFIRFTPKSILLKVSYSIQSKK
jgi:short-subunit dehydrogenase